MLSGDITLPDTTLTSDWFRTPTPAPDVTTEQGQALINSWVKQDNPYAEPPAKPKGPEPLTPAEEAQIEREAAEMARQEARRRAEADAQRRIAEEQERIVNTQKILDREKGKS
jgi:hypothetical protein